MLNLNPAMRPSAAQLLQHERISLTLKVTEAEKILTSVKSHRAENTTRERDLNAREAMLREREQQIVALVAQKDSEIANLQRILSVVGEQQNQYSQQYLDAAIKEAVARREDELRILVTKREKEVADAMARREEEIMEAVRRREVEVCEAWTAREAEIKKELADSVRAVDERIEWIQTKEEELKEEEGRLETAQAELNDKLAKWEETITKGRKEKMPLEEIKNFSTRQGDDILHRRKQDNPTPRPTQKTFPALATPVLRPPKLDSMPSAMKGVMLTSTGEILATPTPAELAKLFDNSPKVGLNFAKIFDFEDGDEDGTEQAATSTPSIDREASPPPSPSSRKEKEKEKVRVKAKATTSTRRRGASSSDAESAAPSPIISSSGVSSDAPPTRLRRPSIRSKSKSKSQMQRSATLPSSVSDPTSLSTASTSQAAVKPLSHPHLSNTATRDRVTVGVNRPQPEYDLADEENLPSPFLKRNLDRGVQSSSSRPPVQLVHQAVPAPLALFYGFLSSLAIAIHAVLVKSSLPHVGGSSTMLSYWSNFGSAVLLGLLALLNGEVFEFYGMINSGSWDWSTFFWGNLVTGIFGFLISIAGILSVKVTSPVTHMFSSAARSGLQVFLGVKIFGDVFTTQRAFSVSTILTGTLLYTYVKSREGSSPSSSSSSSSPPTKDIEAQSPLIQEKQQKSDD
ncbi:hypothetical protein H0H93_006094 [Arthromyces matolae]|nr:hypothetical protein H0H93_006094 [Arthromyces matolae]